MTGGRLVPAIAVSACSTAAPAAALAGGWRLYVSTPLAPPIGHPLLPYAFLLLVLAVLSVCLSRAWPSEPAQRWRVFPTAVAAIAAFCFSTHLFTVDHTSMNRAYTPQPCRKATRPCCGLSLTNPAAYHFLKWNAVSVAMLGTTAVLAMRVRSGCWLVASLTALSLASVGLDAACQRRLIGIDGLLLVTLLAFALALRRDCLRSLAAILSVYLLALVPLVYPCHLFHGRSAGWPGLDCDDNLSNLSVAALLYARDHNGLLPPGESALDILPELRPYLRRLAPVHDGLLGCLTYAPLSCSFSEVYYGDTTSLRWNAHLSNVSVASLTTLSAPPNLFFCAHSDDPDHFAAFPRPFPEIVDAAQRAPLLSASSKSTPRASPQAGLHGFSEGSSGSSTAHSVR